MTLQENGRLAIENDNRHCLARSCHGDRPQVLALEPLALADNLDGVRVVEQGSSNAAVSASKGLVPLTQGRVTGQHNESLSEPPSLCKRPRI